MMDAMDALVNELDSKIEQLKEALASGRSASLEEYKHMCGEIRGLLTARGYALDLKQRMENSDE
jgi:hypothetical protein